MDPLDRSSRQNLLTKALPRSSSWVWRTPTPPSTSMTRKSWTVIRCASNWRQWTQRRRHRQRRLRKAAHHHHHQPLQISQLNQTRTRSIFKFSFLIYLIRIINYFKIFLKSSWISKSEQQRPFVQFVQVDIANQWESCWILLVSAKQECQQREQSKQNRDGHY